MVQSRFHTPQILEFAKMLSGARTPQDLAIAHRQLGSDSYGIRAIVSLPVYEPGSFPYLPIALPSSLFKDHVVPYFQYRYFYIIHHEQLQLPRLAIDYTITFDTNSASYVKEIVRARSLDGQQPEVKRAFHDLLYNDFNFDLFFYFVENIKVAYPIGLKMRNSEHDSPLTFWKALDRKFRWNIVCLELFRSINCKHYRETRELKFDISFIEAVRLSVNFTYGFYVSQQGSELISELLLPMQRLILFQLIAFIRIQFSSIKSAKNKLEQFLAFVQDKGLPFLDRETVLAFKYFRNRKDTPILNQINKGGKQKGLWKNINNLAWDLSAVRFMERMFTVRQHGDYMIPFFFSFDKKLRYFIGAFPAKAVIIDRMSEGVLSVPELNTREYFEQEECSRIVANFFSPEKTNERFSKIRKDPNITIHKIRSEYKQLRMVLLGAR